MYNNRFYFHCPLVCDSGNYRALVELLPSESMSASALTAREPEPTGDLVLINNKPCAGSKNEREVVEEEEEERHSWPHVKNGAVAVSIPV